VCGVVYLTPAVMLLLAPMGASVGTMLVYLGIAKVGGILEIVTGSDV
jgi:hypothetical protein